MANLELALVPVALIWVVVFPFIRRRRSPENADTRRSGTAALTGKKAAIH